MASIFRTMPPEYRKCFTVDLVPHSKDALALWREGICGSDTVHIPTQEWLDRLANDHPEIEAARPRCRTELFGTKIEKDFKLDKKPLYKREIQSAFKLSEEDQTILFIARNRWTDDDQKNYRAIIDVIDRVIEATSKQGWEAQFIIGPLNKPPNDASRQLSRELRALANRHRRQVKIETLRFKKRPNWSDLLKAADAQLLPSRFEPCGISHAQGMMYGTLPICSLAGAMGLSPVSKSNSFQFAWEDRALARSNGRFYKAIMGACRVRFRHPDRWLDLQQAARDASLAYDWERLLPRYVKFFGARNC